MLPVNAQNQRAACNKSFTGTSQNGDTKLRSGVNRRCRSFREENPDQQERNDNNRAVKQDGVDFEQCRRDRLAQLERASATTLNNSDASHSKRQLAFDRMLKK